jgi:TRAP-type C4-dicarboxylate transport system substrate-binding protein
MWNNHLSLEEVFSMKKLLSLVLMLTVLLSMAGISQAEMVLKLGHYANADHAGNDAAKMFAEGVETHERRNQGGDLSEQ